MKTSLMIPDAVYRATKQRAVAAHRTVGAVVEDALREWLAKEERSTAYELRWRTVAGREVPAVDPNDRDVLYDAMEGRT